MPYVDAQTVSDPTTGQPILAAWGDQIRANQEFFIDPPACSVSNSGTQDIENTMEDLAADSESFDNDSMHSTSTNTERITIQTAGRYLLIATISFPSTGDGGTRRVQFLENGTTAYVGLNVPANTSTVSVITVTRTIVLAASDYVTVQASQGSGGSIATTLHEFAAMYLTR